MGETAQLGGNNGKTTTHGLSHTVESRSYAWQKMAVKCAATELGRGLLKGEAVST